MKKGFVKINRDITEWQWYKEPLTVLLYIHLIITANWCDTNFKGVKMKRGERVVSYATLATETGLSVQNVRTALSHLFFTGEVTKRKSGKYTVISITNYNEHQSTNNNLNREFGGYSNSNLTTDKEYKNNKNDKEDEEEKKQPSSSVSEVINLYRDICKSLPTPVLTADTESNIRRAISFYGIDKIRKAFETIENTPFLRGKVKNWCADINWVFINGNIDKILSGRYRDYSPQKPEDDFDASKYECLFNRFDIPSPQPIIEDEEPIETEAERQHRLTEEVLRKFNTG